jgi:hypothetical protein
VAQKKKPRTPPPPRTVQAPKERIDPMRMRREGPGGPRDPRKTRLLFIGLFVAIVAIALAAGLGIALGGGGGGGDLSAGGCVAQTFPALDRNHATQLPKGYEYNSFPPTSGTHNPTPAIWNIYDEPIRQMLLVHNLEHGGVVVQYGDQVPQATIDQIRAWYEADPDAIVVAPLAVPEDENAVRRTKVYLTAWTHLLTCPAFSEKAFDGFKDSYRGKGPERFPVDSLKPGT